VALALARATGPGPLGAVGRCAVQATASRARAAIEVIANVPFERRDASREVPAIREFDLGSFCKAAT
jgi:hypothetical protein